MSSDSSAAPTPIPRKGWASLRDLNKYQWFVFCVAAIAWMADCMDQQLFNLARVMSLTDLLGGAAADPNEVKTWAARSTSVFLIGWATGGLVFGMYGDRIGRVRTLTYTILLYSFFTGFSALSQGPVDYCLYRFLTGLGVGGVFAAAVALLAETMPSHARPFTLGLMQALSAVGNCTAALMFIALGLLELNGHLDALTHGTSPGDGLASKSFGRPSTAARRTAVFSIPSRSQFPLMTTDTAFTSVLPSFVTVRMSAYSSSTFASSGHVSFASVFTSIIRKNGVPSAYTLPPFRFTRSRSGSRFPMLTATGCVLPVFTD